MGNYNPTYFDRVEYILEHSSYGKMKIEEPIGWQTDEKEYARNRDYNGIVTKFSNSLKFYNDGADYIRAVKSIYGINAEIRLIRNEKHPHTDVMTRSYSGFLDMTTFEDEDGQISIKFNAGGIEKQLKARQNEKIEIDRTTTLDGNEIESINTEEVLFEGRRIFLKSKWGVNESNNQAFAGVESNNGSERHQTTTLPIVVQPNSHQDICQSPIPQTSGSENTGDLNMMFLFDCNRIRTFDIKINGTLDAHVTQYEAINWASFKICLSIYENGFDFNLKKRIVLYALEDNHPLFDNENYSTLSHFTVPNINFQFDDTLTLLEGESLALEVKVASDMNYNSHAGLRVSSRNIECEMIVEENSYFPQSVAKMVFAHEVGEKLTEVISNRKAFYSEVLGRKDLGYSKDGAVCYTGLTHGFWIRQFQKDDPNIPEEENKFKPLTINFKDFSEFLNVVWNIGVGIERIGFQERIRVEDMSYFFNNNVTIKLPNQVKKVKRSIATDYYYSSVEIGYDKGGEYEEAMGLDEANIKNNYSTCITATENSLTKVSKVRTDPYGVEFPRRKPVTQNPTEDTSYDKDVYALDCKQGRGSVYELRKWQDDFQQAPTGIFSPETVFNLRLTPFNNMLKRFDLPAGLEVYPDQKVRYASSEGNSSLKTQFQTASDFPYLNGNEYAENGDITNSELRSPRFIPEWIEFEHEVDFEINQALESFTEINGVKIPNMYGLVEFTNEKGEKERGYLFNLKPNKEGKWKLLKSIR
tara:strand:- start:540 stop:2801 length:2262 start_codon:yes stop_codon:yes gene_type:complete